jgi:RNA polymerase sigma-70 factor (ECF subfamily)
MDLQQSDVTTVDDSSALAGLIQRHYPGLLAVLRRRTRDAAGAEDALNQALAISLAHYRAGRISDPNNIAGYVFQVAINHLRNHRRKMDERADKRVDPEALDNLSAGVDVDDSPSDRAKLAAEVRKVLEALPTARDREIVKRFYLDEEEKEPICRDLGLSPLHFDKVIFRARQRMRRLLEESGFRKTDYLSVLMACFA